MGIVLHAIDEALQRHAAIKILRPNLLDAQARKRFAREARAAASIKHDHVVGIYGVSETSGGLPYCVLEYISGLSLAERIRVEGRLDPREAASITAQIADGLAAAHDAGVVHRDVKPSNILIDTQTGRAKIADFGLARAEFATSGDSRTLDGSVAGTPAYMSPEQAKGAEHVDGLTDIYGLGVTLYEAITGEVPFRGTTQIVLRQIEEDDPRPPRELNDKVPLDLQTICLKCLKKEPRSRYTRASDLADDLRRFLDGRPITARPASRAEKVARWCRRNPLAFRLIAGLVLCVVIIGSLAVWAILAESSARTSAREAVTKSEISEAIEEFLAKDLLAQSSAFNQARGGIRPDPDLTGATAL